MKRLFCLLLALVMLLAGCGAKTAEVPATEAPTTAATEPPTEAPTTEATEPTTEATEPETEPTEPPVPVNPLTGETLEAPYTGRPVAFSLNNISACLPQHGLQHLDWMFEVETEGGITRCVGVMTDPSKANTVGPIRSCRTYFLSLSVGYNAPLFHCGCSIYATNKMYSRESSVSSWDHVDQKSHGSYYYRDGTRSSQGYAYEHTLFTTGERMVKAFDALGYTKTDDTEVTYGYTFADKVDPDGTAATTVQIPFQGGKVTTMEYDAESGQYLAHQYNSDWIDGDTGENAEFRNILVITAAQSKKKSKYGNHSFYEMLGTGTGYYAVDGKLVTIQWHRDKLEEPYRFTYEDGTPITLGVGKTYCAIVDDDCVVTGK